MRVLFDASIPVAYHFFGIVSRGEDSAEVGGWLDAYIGQANGLCGASVSGQLAFKTGTHTDMLPVRVEAHESEPSVDQLWEEVVEASFTTVGPEVELETWDGDEFPIDLAEGVYRVRYCATGFDNEANQVTDSPERYLVQFWAAPAEPDRVLRQTRSGAAYWHEVTATKRQPQRSTEPRASGNESREHQSAQESWNALAPTHHGDHFSRDQRWDQRRYAGTQLVAVRSGLGR